MNTATILNIKTSKSLKEEARSIAAELGLPLSTVINAFLRQFVRERSVTFDARLAPTPYLERVMEEARREYKASESGEPKNSKDFIAHLKTVA